MPRILVIIVTYNGMQWIERCICSVAQSSVKADILAVDNGSTDGTLEFLKGRKDVQLVCPGENLGFGAANNIGLKKVLDEGYDFAYLLNQDAWIEKDTLEKLVAASNDVFAILSPVQRDAEGNLDRQFEKWCGESLKNAPEKAAEVKFVMAAHWLVSRSAIETVGGFSPAFKQYGEDDNWIDRARYFGLKVGVVPDASAVHDRAARKPAKQARMKLKCVAPVAKLSNPGNYLPFRVLAEPIELILMSLKNCSVIPLTYLPTLIRRYKSILSLRKASKNPGAFLDLQTHP